MKRKTIIFGTILVSSLLVNLVLAGVLLFEKEDGDGFSDDYIGRNYLVIDHRTSGFGSVYHFMQIYIDGLVLISEHYDLYKGEVSSLKIDNDEVSEIQSHLMAQDIISLEGYYPHPTLETERGTSLFFRRYGIMNSTEIRTDGNGPYLPQNLQNILDYLEEVFDELHKRTDE